MAYQTYSSIFRLEQCWRLPFFGRVMINYFVHISAQISVSHIFEHILWIISVISSPAYVISSAGILSTRFSEYIALTTSYLKILSSLSSFHTVHLSFAKYLCLLWIHNYIIVFSPSFNIKCIATHRFTILRQSFYK